MKTLYFECKMGAAGDMLMAALYEICDQKELFLQTMNQAFSEYGIQISAEESKKCGISGTHMHVMINGEEEGVHVHEHVHTHTHDHTEAEHVHTNEHEAAEHHHDESSHAHTHHSYQSVLAQIEHLQLPAQVKADAAAIYRLIGEAESAVHNTTLEQIHFHEVGTLDALADVCGFIENHGENFKVCGYWKVYADTDEAKKIFEEYSECSREFCRHWRAGGFIGELAAAV